MTITTIIIPKLYIYIYIYIYRTARRWFPRTRLTTRSWRSSYG